MTKRLWLKSTWHEVIGAGRNAAAIVAQIDLARGHRSRSQCCRDALLQYLQLMGVIVEESEVAPPHRRGKGGPMSRRKYPGGGKGYMLNDKSKSTKAANSKE